MLAQLRYVDRLPQSANHIPNQPLVASHILARNHRSLRNSTMPNQRRLNLPWLNPEAAQLHLTIRTPDKLQNPVQYVNPQVGNATTDQTASTRSDKASVEQHITDMHGRLGDTVHIDEGR